jgi:peptide deformylase
METSKVILLGNPLLRLKSEAIGDEEFGSAALKQIETELFEVMKVEQGLGLAAPQIGINKRAIVFGMEKHPVHTHLPMIPFTMLFNPSYIPIADECVEDYEGCLSVGALRGKVSRYKTIRYRGYDVEGQLIEREVSDLHARVFQHEYDHLDGVIFLDKITNVNSLGFHDELVRSGELKAS